MSKIDDPFVGEAIWSGFLSNATIPMSELFSEIKLPLLKFIKERNHRKIAEPHIVAAYILASWIGDKSGKNRAISNNEMRDILLSADEEFRSQIILYYEQWLTDDEDKIDKTIVNLAAEFFDRVWPKQVLAKSAEVSARLFNLAVYAMDKIDSVVDLIIPLMQVNESAKIRSSNSLNIYNESNIMAFPKNYLKLLYAILPEDAKNWPYGLDEILPKLVESNSNLVSDLMYIELKRRWDSR